MKHPEADISLGVTPPAEPRSSAPLEEKCGQAALILRRELRALSGAAAALPADQQQTVSQAMNSLKITLRDQQDVASIGAQTDYPVFARRLRQKSLALADALDAVGRPASETQVLHRIADALPD